MYVTMAPNPSHLEAVDPVVVGHGARGRAPRRTAGAPRASIGRITLPILIHGDAAFPGQGVVAETLNLSPAGRLRHRRHDSHHREQPARVHGRRPSESYSTSYASGLARGFKIPIVHVNADDPVACLEAARLAWEYRARFGLDFLIDLVGYRRYGHNEGDEPSFTQPVDVPDDRGAPDRARDLGADARRQGHDRRRRARRARRRSTSTMLETTYASLEAGAGVPSRRCRRSRRPGAAAQGVHRRAARAAARAQRRAAASARTASRSTASSNAARERRKAALANPDERSVDWATAEELALATILADGIPVRLTGEDVERGTFSHRHAVFHDANDRAAAACRCRSSRRRARRSRSTTARSARTRRSASSSATTCRRRGAS